MRAFAIALTLLAVPSLTRAQAPSFRVDDASGCVSADSLRAAFTEVLGDATDAALAGLLIEVKVTERRVAIALRRPSGLVGARSLDLGGQACDERHATLALVVAVLASSAGPEHSLRVSPQTRWEVRAAPPPETGEGGADLSAPPPKFDPPAGERPWIFAAGYRLLPGWLPTLGQGLEATVGGRLGPAELGGGVEGFVPRNSLDRPGVRVAAAGLRFELRLPLLTRARWRLSAVGALGAGIMTGAGRSEVERQERRDRHGYLRSVVGLDLALPLGRGLALTVNAGAALTPWRPRFVAEDVTTMERTELHAAPLLTATFGMGLRWNRSR